MKLSDQQIAQLTHFKQPRKQVQHLQEQGYKLARLVDGKCVLTIEHYNAVESGLYADKQPARVTAPTWSHA
jgi:hypothetical protein